jgi:hypothetical protein
LAHIARDGGETDARAASARAPSTNRGQGAR